MESWVFGLMEVWVLLTASVAPTFILLRALKPVPSLSVLLEDSDTLCPISPQVFRLIFPTPFLFHRHAAQTVLVPVFSVIDWCRLWHLNFRPDTLQQAA